MAIVAALALFRQSVENLLNDAYLEVWLLAQADEFDESHLDEIQGALDGAMGFLDEFLDEVEIGLATTDDLEALLDSNLGRAMMYAGGAWALYNQAKIFGQPPEGLWYWEGPVDSRSCNTCAEEVAAGPRPLKEITIIPGQDTECLTRCRHTLERVK